jgi:DNA-binding transcriptional ArsR family regulator
MAPARSAALAADTVFRAVADPVRRAILDRLRSGPLPVQAIAGAFPISRPAVSRHLRILRSANLLRQRRSGRQQLYELDPAPLFALDQWLERHRSALRGSLGRLKSHVEADIVRDEVRDDQRAGRS